MRYTVVATLRKSPLHKSVPDYSHCPEIMCSTFCCRAFYASSASRGSSCSSSSSSSIMFDLLSVGANVYMAELRVERYPFSLGVSLSDDACYRRRSGSVSDVEFAVFCRKQGPSEPLYSLGRLLPSAPGFVAQPTFVMPPPSFAVQLIAVVTPLWFGSVPDGEIAKFIPNASELHKMYSSAFLRRSAEEAAAASAAAATAGSRWPTDHRSHSSSEESEIAAR